MPTPKVSLLLFVCCLLKMDSDTVVQASPVASACSVLQLQACLSMPDTVSSHLCIYVHTHIYISCSYVYFVSMCICATVHTLSQRTTFRNCRSWFSFHRLGPRDQTQGTRLGNNPFIL